MAISEIYTGTGTATLATVAATPLCSLIAPTTKRGWIIGVRVSLGVSAAAAGNSVLFQLFKITNPTLVAGGTTGNQYPNDTAGPANALCIFMTSGYSTAPTGTANCVWQQELPQTTGSSWEEFPPLGYEYCLNVGGTQGGFALWATCSVATASTVIYYELVWSE
jgi:hypothetical protein